MITRRNCVLYVIGVVKYGHRETDSTKNMASDSARSSSGVISGKIIDVPGISAERNDCSASRNVYSLYCKQAHD